MKRLIPAAIVLLLTFSLCIIGNYTSQKLCNETVTILNECKEQYLDGDITKASATAKRLKNEWQKKEAILAIFVNHGPLDGVSLAVNQIKNIISTENTPSFLKSCSDAEHYLTLIHSEQSLSAESLY